MSGIESPCVKNCCLDKDDVCLGCGRTMDEIMRWDEVDDADKRKILVAASGRLKAKRAGRKDLFYD